MRDEAASPREDADHRAWLDLHLSRAAAALPSTNWEAVYPPVAATRNWVGSAVLVLATVALAVAAMPRHIAVQKAQAEAALAAAGIAQPGVLDNLPPELRKQLADLLAAINAGKISTADASQKLADLSQKISPLDPRFAPMLADLAKKLKDAAAKKDQAEQTAAGRSDRGQPQPSEDVKQAAEELADKLNNSNNAKPGESANGQSTSAQSGEAGQSSAQTPMSASIQLSQMSASDDNGQMMMTGTGSMTGDPRSGAGGHGAPQAKGAGADAIAKALKQETIEAATEAPGENVTKEDIRRKTTQGTSSMSFSHAAPAATYDTSHAVGTPVVPDARRALLQRYFIRREP
jgi:hypothetical protein